MLPQQKEEISVALKTLNSTEDSIKGASKFIRNFFNMANEVAPIFHSEINKAPPNAKLLIIYVMHDIMNETKDKNFVKAFGNVSKNLFSDVADVVNEKNILLQCLKIFKVWEKEFLYTKDYIEKLKQIIQRKVLTKEKIKIKIDTIEGKTVTPQETKPETQMAEEKPQQTNQKTYSKTFLRDYNNMNADPFAREYYQRKLQENQYSKYEERILEIQNMIAEKDKNINNPEWKEKLRESMKFLKEAQSQYNDLLLNTSLFMCKMSKNIEKETKKWVNTGYEKYEEFESLIQRRKNLLSE